MEPFSGPRTATSLGSISLIVASARYSKCYRIIPLIHFFGFFARSTRRCQVPATKNCTLLQSLRLHRTASSIPASNFGAGRALVKRVLGRKRKSHRDGKTPRKFQTGGLS